MRPLDQPHHDGSRVYLETGRGADTPPHLEDHVTVRVRTSALDPVEAMWVRTTYDAEPVYHLMVGAPVAADSSSRWWSGTLPVHNPVTHYRFLLMRGTEQQWLTGAGLVDHDVPDAYDFKISAHPEAPDWARDGVVYQIFPDRFARSSAADQRPTPSWAVPAGWDDAVAFEPTDPHTPVQFFGGDLDGITDHLDHVAGVGADIVYTTPVFPAESNHRYNASSFDRVDPLLGGDEAYSRLSRATHARGWRIIGDLTTNHTGDTHEWFRTAQSDPESPERDYYCFRPDGDYECWMNHHTLPKIDHTSPGVRARMVEGPDSVVARWMRPPFSLDGWRIDVANMTGRLGAVDVAHEVARATRRTATHEQADAWVIGEHNHDATGDVDGDGWHGAMNYSGFSWPVWSWLRDPDTKARAFGRPVVVPRRDGHAFVRALRDWQGTLGWRATTAGWNILGSHDSARIRTLVGSPAVHRVAAGLQFTMPGIPMIFAGDEIGLEGVLGEDSRRPMPWDTRDHWDHSTLATYSALTRVRREHIALRRGSLRWAHVESDAVAFLREHPDGSVLVTARRAAGPAIEGLPPGRLLLATEEVDSAVGSAHDEAVLTIHALD